MNKKLDGILGMKLVWNKKIASAIVCVYVLLAIIASSGNTAAICMEWSVGGFIIVGLFYVGLAVALDGKWVRYNFAMLFVLPASAFVVSRFRRPLDFTGLVVPNLISQFLLAFAAALFGIVFRTMKEIVRRMKRVPEGYCQRCGYDLRGCASGICSECGLKIEKCGVEIDAA
ncbi:MAG: hypothetical protein IPK83_21635 [Planctomycetes bacterium]|nr:hypothetical protein [Planctomycetota bacterium]